MRILFLSRWFPYPANNGSKLRIYNLLRGLSSQHDVRLVSFYEPSEGEPDLSGLRSLCSAVKTIPWREYRPSSLRALLGFFSLAPRSAVDTFSPQMAQTIRSALREDCDFVIASQMDMAAYLPYFSSMPAMLEEAEVGTFHQKFRQSLSGFGRFRYGLTWLKQRAYLRRLLKGFRVCTVVSEQEAGLVRSAAPDFARVEVIPNGVDLEAALSVRAKPQPATMIYTGSFRYQANYEAMLWFVTEVFPLVQQAVPAAILTITGDTAGRKLPPVKGVIMTGTVPDVRPLVAGSWLSLAPLQSGGGTRLKILEAFALRTPVVATSKGAEGLSVEHGKQILIADSAADFASEVVSLIKDEEMRARLSTAALQLVTEQYAWSLILPRFLRLVAQAGAGVRNESWS